MKTTLSERDGNTVKLDVEVSAEELQVAFDAQLKKLGREVRIPGFRQGKTPTAMIRQRFGDESIITEAVENKINDWFQAAAAEAELDVVDRPSIDIGEELPELGKSLTFKATVTVMPEVVLGEYKGLEVPKDKVEVADAEVNSQVERMQSECAQLLPVTDRPVRTRDFITVDFSAKLDGEPVPGLEASDYVFEVGAGRLFPEIEVESIGMNIDGEKTFDLTIPKDVGGDEMGGKVVAFTIKVKEIKEKELPRMTDKWASEVSEFETLLELRQDIRGRLEAQKQFSVDQKFRQAAVQAAADNVTIDIPEAVVRETAQGMVQDFGRSLQQQGADLQGYFDATGATAESIVQDFMPGAERDVKTGLVLDAVAKAENLEVTEEDINGSFEEMATASRADAATIRHTFEQAGRLDSVKWQILREKSASFIAENAVPVAAVEPEVEAPVAEAAPEAEAEPIVEPVVEPEATEAPAEDSATTAE